MSTALAERVYATRDNSIDLELREDGQAIDLTGVTRVRLELHSDTDSAAAPIVVDSGITPTAFDFVSQASAGVLLLLLGPILTVADTYNARLVLYDAVNPAGLVWTHEQAVGCGGTPLAIQVLLAADAA